MGRRFAERRMPSRRACSAVSAALTALAALACVTPDAVALNGSAPRGVDSSRLAGRPAGEDAAARRLSALMQKEVDAGAPGVVVRVSDGRKTISLARQAGWTRPDHKLSADDQFRMGSNTKTMVGLLVLQLVAEHKVSLQDRVEKWLPGLVPGGGNITLKMLLNHTSGLFDYINDPGILARVTGADTSSVTPEELLAVSAQYPPLFTPGAEYAYSNTNYAALGLVLEKATGQDLATLLQRRIIRPLGLHDTYLATSGASRDGDKLADGYEPDAEHLAPLLPPEAPKGTAFAGPARGAHVLVTSLNPEWAWAAGAIVSTPADEQRFLRALASGKLLPPAQLAEMETTVVETPGDPASARYGLGIERYLSPCGPVWGHTGGVPGYSSQNYTDETGKRSVTVVATTLFGMRAEGVGAADQKVVDAAVCTMLGKSLPADAN
ncbi:serine hydrolase domain-containing protein [Streptomyces sp. NPDC059629]|uniref:serine hydrolase domain-containing protein n=1 Tax=Streptomyces sp. NPDC059629 TaxID=3346889 RepID=UPI0036A9907B